MHAIAHGVGGLIEHRGRLFCLDPIPAQGVRAVGVLEHHHPSRDRTAQGRRIGRPRQREGVRSWLALGGQDGLEGADLGVGFCGGSNNSRRTFVSVCGACIRLAGTGPSFGHTGGRTTPRCAQPEIASAQISNGAVSVSLCMFFVLFVLAGDSVERDGLPALDSPRGFAGLGRQFGNVLRVLGVGLRDRGELHLSSERSDVVTGREGSGEQQHGNSPLQVVHAGESGPLPEQAT